MGRRGYVDERAGMVLFWSQKSACTTMMSALSRTYGGKNRDYRQASLDWRGCSKLISERGYRTAIAVRHPAERIVSSFVNKFVRYRDRALRRRTDLEPFATRLLDRHKARLGLSGATNDLSFEGFLETVADLMAERRDHTANSVNGHWDTQIPLAALNFEYDHILRVEDFETGFEALCRRYGYDYARETRNATAYGPGAGRYLGDVPACDLAEARFDARDFLSPRTERLIRVLYAIDYIRFGY